MRVADVGGWTDTWFAGVGAVCSVAVGAGTRATVEVGPGRVGDPVAIEAPDLGAAWTTGPDPQVGWARPRAGDHPLLDHGVAAVVAELPDGWLGPDGASLHLTVASSVPPGSAVGTSASVLVAVVAAVGVAVDRPRPPSEVARLAHRAETGGAGRESGVQDHVAAAHGGVSWIEVDPYPTWRRSEVAVPDATAEALARRLVTVHLGGGHDSSVLHRVVIERARAGDAAVHGVLGELRGLASVARDRLAAGDLEGWAATLAAATQEQARLHPALVGDDARAVIDLAAAHGCRGGQGQRRRGLGRDRHLPGARGARGRGRLATGPRRLRPPGPDPRPRPAGPVRTVVR